MNLQISSDITGTMRGASGQDLKQCGTAAVFIRTGKTTKKMVKFLVCENMTSEVLVGVGDLLNLGIISQDFPKMPDLLDDEEIECLRVEKEESEDKLDYQTAEEKELVRKLKLKYKEVFIQTLDKNKTISKGPVEIKLRPGTTPYQLLNARTTPIHFRTRAAKLTKELLESEVIRRVTEAREWTSPAHFVTKPGTDTLRLVTDYRRLNDTVIRPVTPFPSPGDIMKRIQPGSLIFCSMDAKHGYYQLQLSQEASKMTTFLLEDGRFEYLRAPQGLVSSGDHFNGVMQEIFRGLGPSVHVEIDDILITGKSIVDLEEKINMVLERCRAHGLQLGDGKFKIGKKINFAGFEVSSAGVKPNRTKMSALQDFPIPKDVSSLKSFLGLAQVFGVWHPDLSGLGVRLWVLLTKNTPFVWTAEHQADFEKMKDSLSEAVSLKPFDQSKKTVLITDASKLHGIGFILIQLDEQERVSVIQCGSASLNAAEKNYSVIELELLGITYGLQKTAFYTKGTCTNVWTDHRPLVG
ncbi:reverse transcriptase family protein, partial [Litorimonas sp.]|uniref:reverse transcriptase family protein n=1 Tax=Litorimonas sp. TaxID=1892381 RepID=UPI003A8B1341